MKKFNFLFVFLFGIISMMSLVAAQITIGGESSEGGNVINLEPPTPEPFMNNTGSVNLSQFAEIWLANECPAGECDNVADLTGYLGTLFANLSGDTFTGFVNVTWIPPAGDPTALFGDGTNWISSIPNFAGFNVLFFGGPALGVFGKTTEFFSFSGAGTIGWLGTLSGAGALIAGSLTGGSLALTGDADHNFNDIVEVDTIGSQADHTGKIFVNETATIDLNHTGEFISGQVASYFYHDRIAAGEGYLAFGTQTASKDYGLIASHDGSVVAFHTGIDLAAGFAALFAIALETGPTGGELFRHSVNVTMGINPAINSTLFERHVINFSQGDIFNCHKLANTGSTSGKAFCEIEVIYDE